MGYVTNSLAAQSAIINANNAQMAIIKANQAQQDLLGSKGNINSIARKEAQIEADRIKAQTQAQVAKAQKNTLKKGRKMNFYA